MLLRIAVTGAPCSGKSKVIPYIKERIEKDGLCSRVFVVSESATELIRSGLDPKNRFHFQKAVFDSLFSREEVISAYCRGISGEKELNVVIEDRCLCDGKAYLTGEEWKKLLSLEGATEEELYGRYDFFLHLKSVATLDKSLYRNETGITRRNESAEEALELEELACEIYDVCGNAVIIPAQESFEEKTVLVQNTVSEFIQKFCKHFYNSDN